MQFIKMNIFNIIITLGEHFHFFRVLYIFTSVRYTIFSTGMGDINFEQENSILQQTDMESNFDD